MASYARCEIRPGPVPAQVAINNWPTPSPAPPSHRDPHTQAQERYQPAPTRAGGAPPGDLCKAVWDPVVCRATGKTAPGKSTIYNYRFGVQPGPVPVPQADHAGAGSCVSPRGRVLWTSTLPGFPGGARPPTDAHAGAFVMHRGDQGPTEGGTAPEGPTEGGHAPGGPTEGDTAS